MITVSLVIPCYNEEEVLPETVRRLGRVISELIDKRKLSADSAAYFVDDGSRDRTWAQIEEFSRQHAWVRGIKLSRNRGHQNALLAGLLTAPGDAMISLDADLQDDLAVIEQMVDAYASGSEIVFGVRKNRGRDSFFKRFTAEQYYRLLARVGVDVVFNHADYRLMGRRAIEALRGYGEVNLFLRGIILELGYRTSIVYYDRGERFAGESKYPFTKMLALAIQGVTSFSAAPLRIITGLGALVSVLSLAVAIWALWVRLFTDQALPGWASTVVPIYFLGGIQLLCVGVIGEYLAKVYMETKRRPRFHVEGTTYAEASTRAHIEAPHDRSPTSTSEVTRKEQRSRDSLGAPVP